MITVTPWLSFYHIEVVLTKAIFSVTDNSSEACRVEHQSTSLYSKIVSKAVILSVSLI